MRRIMRAEVHGEARSCEIYDEAAFRYLLDNENKRAKRIGRSFYLIVVCFAGPEAEIFAMDDRMKSILLSAILDVLRETDYVGWYRDGHVLGGVLTTVKSDLPDEVAGRIEQRLWRKIERKFPADQFARLRVRFVSSEALDCVDSAECILVAELSR